MKSLHLIGVILLLGNVTVTFMWKLLADRRGTPEVVAFAQRSVIWNDWAFTAFGAAIIVVSGYGMAWAADLNPISISWLFWSQVWFYASGLLWLLVLVPIQALQARQARRFVHETAVPKSYRLLVLHWNIWGILATLMLLVPLFLMIAKV